MNLVEYESNVDVLLRHFYIYYSFLENSFAHIRCIFTIFTKYSL